MKTYKSLLFIVLLFLCSSLNAQNNLDSLKNKSYKELHSLFFKTKNYEQKELISSFYLRKAKKENNIREASIGYEKKHHLYGNTKKGMIYADSLIIFSLKDNNFLAATNTLIGLGSYYYNKKNIKKSLDYYLKAREYADNKSVYNKINYSLGLIKTRLGKHREALNIFKEVLSYREKNYEERKNLKGYYKYPKSSVLSSKYAVANSYKDLNLLDSASYFNKIGMKESAEIKKYGLYHLFVLNQGTVDYLNKSYKVAIDSLKIAEKYFRRKKDVYNYAETSYYLGESYLKINNTKEAIFYFKKVDSAFNVSPILLPITRNSFEHLINHYKNKKDLRKQLKYLVQLKKMDSVYLAYGTYSNNKFLKEYDLPLIIGETKKINALLEKRRQFLNNVIGAITVVLIGVLSLLVFQYRRRKLYKARFNEIVNTETHPATNELKKVIEELTISKEIVSEILTALDQFERNKNYLNSAITLQSLAKEFNTNANYLSKVINHYKNGSYSKYVTGLRIQFAIDQLKTNNTFRKYTIKAIAKEVGFNNPESFSKAFYAKTGIKPSYFIKELEKIK